MFMKIGQLAASIGTNLSLGEDVVRNQLRGLRDRGLLKPVPGTSGVDRFEAGEAYVARILLAGLDGGIIGDSLRTLAYEVREGRTAVFPDSGNYPINLAANVSRIVAGEDWLIECARSREPEHGGIRFSALWVRRQSDGRINRFGSHHADPTARETTTIDGAVVESVFTINVSSLLKPLLSEVATEA